jgi:epoxyqueuosine reductase
VSSITVSQRTELVKRKARELGFDFCGISKADFLEEEAPRLEQWLKQGRQGKMAWMENYFDLRLDPRLLVPGAKSVICFALNYFPEKELEGELKISKYAYGQDYHRVIKKKLKVLLEELRKEIGEINGRAFTDSAPVMDKAWAKKSGIGWVGKNSNLITKQSGSFFFLAELIVDIELEYDGSIPDFCGTCTRCVDECPTDAIIEPYVVDGSKCISYLTIELKENLPAEFKGKMENWIYGCDICQDVCPWNSFSRPHTTPAFAPSQELSSMNKKQWQEITEEVFNVLFERSAVKRTKLEGLKRNIAFLNPEAGAI